MARGLSNEQKFVVQQQILEGKDVESIINETGFPSRLVKEYLERLEISLAKAKTNKPSAPDPSIKAEKLFHRLTGNKREGITAHTQASSERVDENRKKIGDKITDRMKECIRPVRAEDNF